jgi:hypothetical protein
LNVLIDSCQIKPRIFFKMNITLKSDFFESRDSFSGVYENDLTRITLILFSSFFTICFLFPFLISFLWYCYFGPHSERVILNRLISSVVETLLGYLIFVHYIDIFRYIFGPFSGDNEIIYLSLKLYN